MVLIVIGAIIAGICNIISCYLIVRIAVRDGIDTSTAADWRIMYMREQNKTAGLPQLTSIEDEVASSKYIQNLPEEKRKTEIERFTKYRATKLVRAAHRKRFIITAVAAIAGVFVAGLIIGAGFVINIHNSNQPTYSNYYRP